MVQVKRVTENAFIEEEFNSSCPVGSGEGRTGDIENERRANLDHVILFVVQGYIPVSAEKVGSRKRAIVVEEFRTRGDSANGFHFEAG